MNPYYLYLFIKIDDFKLLIDNSYGFTFLLFIIAFILLIISFTLYNESSYTEQKELLPKYKKVYKVALIVLAFVFSFQFIERAIATALPSTNQLAFILIGDKVINNERIQGLPDKFLSILEAKADEFILESKNNLK